MARARSRDNILAFANSVRRNSVLELGTVSYVLGCAEFGRVELRSFLTNFFLRRITERPSHPYKKLKNVI